MDTKLKKTHKLTKVLLILLTILLPAAVMVGFYPRLEKLANEKMELNESAEPEYIKYIDGSFIMEATSLVYYDYAKWLYDNGLLSEEEFGDVCESTEYEVESIEGTSVLYAYMIDDKIYKNEAVSSYGGDAEELQEAIDKIFNSQESVLYDGEMEVLGIEACYVIEYNDDGELIRNDLYNVDGYEPGLDVDELSDINKSFEIRNAKAVFFITDDSEYIFHDWVGGWYGNEHAYWDIGSPILILAAVAIVALVALILPLIKPLGTGNEKIFRIPLEVSIVLAVIFVYGIIGMFYIMAHTNLQFLENNLDGEQYILGYKLTSGAVYYALSAASILGWALCFFAEYIVVTSLRQLFVKPIKYINERSIIVKVSKKIFRWIKNKIKKFFEKLKEIISSLKPNKWIVLVFVVNMLVAAIACVCWVFGIPLFMIYTVAAYLFVYKKYMKVCEQYETVKDTVHKMGEGNLKIEIEDDLGVFSPICDELVKIKDGFQKALVEEAKSRDMKTELITNVSHDLKTPLTAIITYVDLLKKEDITEEERNQYIATLDMKSQRLKVLIEDLFEVSKANSGNVSMNIMDVDVVGLLKQVRLELEDKIEESKVEFRWNLPDEKIILQLDGQKTYRIFANLINNIVKYSLAGSRAFVEVTENNGQVIVTFKNVSASEIQCDVENLTERFVRGDVSRNTEGSGLGLAIVKSFVELQGGKFNIDVDGDLFKAVIEWSK